MKTKHVLHRHLGILRRRDRHIDRALKETGLPAPRGMDPGFATLIRIIVDQQVSTAAGAAIWRKLEAAAGGSVTPESLHRLGEAGVRANGMSGQKTRYTMGLVTAALAGDLDITALSEAEDNVIREKLTSYKGIGPWTADIYLMFGLGRPDVWPSGDLGLQAGAHLLMKLRTRPTPKRLEAIGESWRPYRSSAAILLWQYYGALRQTQTVTKKAKHAKRAGKQRMAP